MCPLKWRSHDAQCTMVMVMIKLWWLIKNMIYRGKMWRRRRCRQWRHDASRSRHHRRHRRRHQPRHRQIVALVTTASCSPSWVADERWQTTSTPHHINKHRKPANSVSYIPEFSGVDTGGSGGSIPWGPRAPSHKKFMQWPNLQYDILHHLQHGKVILQRTDCMKMFAKNAST